MFKKFDKFIYFILLTNFILIVILNKPQIFPDSIYYYNEGIKYFENNYQSTSLKILYSIWIFINYLSTYFEDNWYFLIILINLSASLIIISCSLYLLNLNKFSDIIIFLFIQLFCVDLWIYNSYILSDLLFTGIALLTFLLVYKYHTEYQNKFLFLASFSLLFLFFLRPTSLPVFIFFIFSFLTKLKKINKMGLVFYLPLFLALILIIALIQYFLIKYQIPFNLEIIKSYIYWKKLQFVDGIVINDRPEYNLNAINNFLSIIKYNIYKLIQFYNFAPIGYSSSHKIINLTYLLIITMAIIKFKYIDKKTLNKNALFLSLLFIISFGIFHMITIIDYDWRYRLPILPILSIMPFLIFKKNKSYVF